jgi:hypothetical protein
MTETTFADAVKSLRGRVAPRNSNKRKSDCTPEEWAATLDYQAAKQHEYRASSPEVREKACRRVAAWRADNPEKHRKYWTGKLQSDPDHKMRTNLRIRLNRAVKGGYKNGSAVRDLGCTVTEFWAHMERLFQPGMTRENIGKAWEIDHIYPLSKANLKDRAEFLAVNNWRNLQPLTPEQNREKGDTVGPDAQVLFDTLKTEFAG